MHAKLVIPAIMLLAVLSVVLPLLVLENVYITFILYYGIMSILVPFLDLKIASKLSWQTFLNQLGFRNNRGLKVGFLHGIALYILILASYFVLRSVVDTSSVLSTVASWGGTNKILVFFLVILFNGFVEELFWRGYCLGRIGMKWSSVVIVTLFYASYHFATIFSFFGITGFSVILVFSIAAAGLLWGWMRMHYNSSWPSTIGHVLATAGYMTVFILL
ncbi:MAG: CPBP family intramembrane glutamic endopeptidase [Candidatus Woesearchaeota archaeon]